MIIAEPDHGNVLFFEKWWVPGSDTHAIQVATYTEVVCIEVVDYNSGVVVFHVDLAHQEPLR